MKHKKSSYSGLLVSLFLFLFLAGGILLQKVSAAGTDIGIWDYGRIMSSVSPYYSFSLSYPVTFQTITANVTYTWNPTGGSSGVLGLWDSPPSCTSEDSGSWFDNCTGAGLLGQATGTPVSGGFSSDATTTWDFGENISLSASTTYYLGFIGPVSYPASQISDMILNGSPLYILMGYPSNNSTTPDFTNWVINWSGNLPYGQVKVNYGLSSTSLNYSDQVSFSPGISSWPLPIPKSQLLWFPPMSDPSTWYAQAEDIGATSTVFSPMIQFNISPGTNAPTGTFAALAGPFLSTAGGLTSSTLANPTLNCQFTSSSILVDPVGNIEEGICNASTFLFVPNMTEQNNVSAIFNSLKTNYGNKPPFGYLLSITSAMSSFNATATSTSFLDLGATTTAGFAGIFNPLDLGLASITWLLTAFWTFHRARTISL